MTTKWNSPDNPPDSCREVMIMVDNFPLPFFGWHGEVSNCWYRWQDIYRGQSEDVTGRVKKWADFDKVQADDC